MTSPESAPHGVSRLPALASRVGRTPLVRLTRLPRAWGVPDTVEIWAKLEWFNPGGSVKDRAALAIVQAALEAGTLRPGVRLLDASSGNTGIAYAWICAALGVPVTLCLPANANAERKRMLAAYGVDLVLTDPLEGSDGAIRRAREIAAQDPDGTFYADQYSNDANWRAHFTGTGPEIWADTAARVTHWVSTLGTSGTFMGTSRFLRPHGVQCVAVQPDSPFHGLEGLKHMETALVPPIYQPQGLVDRQIEAPTEASFDVLRALARDEALLAGPSGGAAVWAALQVARELDQGVVVTLLPDSGTRYLSEEHLWT